MPSDQKLKVALVVVNMPLDGMIDKFKALSNVGQYGFKFSKFHFTHCWQTISGLGLGRANIALPLFCLG